MNHTRFNAMKRKAMQDAENEKFNAGTVLNMRCVRCDNFVNNANEEGEIGFTFNNEPIVFHKDCINMDEIPEDFFNTED